MSHACLTAILARKKPWEPPEPPAWKQPHEFKVGCVALSAATAVLNSGLPATSTKSPVRARRAHGGFSGRARRRRVLALGRGQRERELGVRLQVLHARVEGRDAHVGVARAAVGEAHGVAKRVPRDRGLSRDRRHRAPGHAAHHPARVRGVVAYRGHRHACLPGPPGRLARNEAGERQEQGRGGSCHAACRGNLAGGVRVHAEGYVSLHLEMDLFLPAVRRASGAGARIDGISRCSRASE